MYQIHSHDVNNHDVIAVVANEWKVFNMSSTTTVTFDSVVFVVVTNTINDAVVCYLHLNAILQE